MRRGVACAVWLATLASVTAVSHGLAHAQTARATSDGASAESDADPGRALLVLATGATAMEADYVAELRIALEGVEVRAVEPGNTGFGGSPLPAQLEVVRGLLEGERGLAATWLSPVSSELVLVHMVVLTSGRVLVRMIEGNPTRPGFATDLAMASRELLGTAFLFAEDPPDVTVERMVDEVRQRVSPPPDEPGWALVLRARAGGGLAGFEGPSVLVGGELGVERRLVEGLGVRLWIDARGGPMDAGDPARTVRIVFVSPGLGAAYLFDAVPGLLRIGPTLDLRATWSTLEVASTPETAQTFSQWSVRADLGLELRVALGDRVELLASASAGTSPLRRVLTLRSSGQTLIATPFLAWDASVGISACLP